jgi:hypothetical protein
VLASIALVLAAPVAGRAGFPQLADALMALAAFAGLAAFAQAGFHTLRARHGAAPRSGERSEP